MILSPRRFSFLHVEHEFKGALDWDFPDYGKLWTYNLNYFDFLLDEGLSVDDGLSLMDDFMQVVDSLKNANEPYPISLRIFNWSKFLHSNDIQNPVYTRFVASDLDLLSRQPEYHLMGNHLLENGFALYFGGMMLGQDRFVSQGKRILQRELDEQILQDGGHFELSPMYHCILLERLLDCLNVAFQLEQDDAFLEFLKRKASLMIRWLNTFMFSDGSVAMVNDAAYGIAMEPAALFQYANAMGLHRSTWKRLNDSGYRKLVGGPFELMFDVGRIGPDYIPGHAHSDTLSVVMHYQGTPFLVDTGTSTYEANDIRQRERSTSSHNTVMIGSVEQSEIWGAFRVARRARPQIIADLVSSVTASHDGYKRIGAKHTRGVSVEPDQVVITDDINGKKSAEAYYHFHPDIRLKLLDDNVIKAGNLFIHFTGHSAVEIRAYEFAQGFNRREQAEKIVITFDRELISRFYEHSISE